MKFLLIFLFTANLLFAADLTGIWQPDSIGNDSKLVVEQRNNKVRLHRKMVQDFENEKYIVFHLIQGDLSANKSKKEFNLYVKEAEEEKYEYLRPISFRYIDKSNFELDGVRFEKVVNLNEKNKNVKSDNRKSDNSKRNGLVIEMEKQPESSDDIIMPSGLGEVGGSNATRISNGFNDNESFNKAVKYKKQKKYKKSLEIFNNLYNQKKLPENLSIVPHFVEIYRETGRRAEMDKYCLIIKKYDPFFNCGGIK